MKLAIARLGHDHADLADRHGVPLAYAATVRKHLVDNQEPPEPPTKTDRRKAVAATAYVNHGRWVATCPFCPSAQIVDPDDPRWFCARCGNAFADGAFTTVRFPDDVAAIEAALLARPNEINRNWYPGETVRLLLAENEERIDPELLPEPGPLVRISSAERPTGTEPGV